MCAEEGIIAVQFLVIDEWVKERSLSVAFDMAFYTIYPCSYGFCIKLYGFTMILL